MELYFVAILLPRELDEKILAYKKRLWESFGCQVGLRSPAHITIIPPFRIEEEKEDVLTGALEAISQLLAPFPVMTRNFSSFPPRTIFIDVEKTEALEGVKYLADAYVSQHPEWPIPLDPRPFHPHITLATRDLSRKDFHLAWKWFENAVFREAWLARGLSLLKHREKKWDVLQTSLFQKI
ncbi:MAG: 2'-5' RNA ligase family protein [Flavisolibacter sp.]